MKEELEELDKTTDVLKDFKSKVGEEKAPQDIDEILSQLNQEKSRVARNILKNPEYLDDKTLDLNDNNKLDKINKAVEEVFSNNEDDIEKKLKDGLNKRKKNKRLGLKFICLSLLFLPCFISLIIVSYHSNKLINKNISLILKILTALLFITLIIGLILVIKNIKIKLKPKVKKIFKYIYLFFMVIYTVGCITVLFLLYGPVNDFRDWLVTTAMQTKDHKYLCTWFYNQDEIDEVFSRNYIEEPKESTNEDLIEVEKPATNEVKYKNEYEKAILTKEAGNDLYKIIRFKVNGCNAYLAAIYDPSKVHVTTTDRVGVRGQYVTTMAKREGAKVAINGAGFYDPGYSSSGGCPKGITIVNSKIVTNNEYGRHSSGGLIGLTKENKLVLLKNVTASNALKMGIRDAVSWGPFLIVNGKAAYTSGNGGWGYAARTAIGQRADGIILMLVVDSNYNRTKGADMVNMTKIMQQYGAINAANLDGGTSSVMVVNGTLISHPIDSALQNQTRPIATSFVVTDK